MNMTFPLLEVVNIMMIDHYTYLDIFSETKVTFVPEYWILF